MPKEELSVCEGLQPASGFGVRCTALAVAMALMGGCASNTAYQRPDVRVPEGWQQAEAGRGAGLAPWWQGMNDPTLTRLIQDALARNNNLAQAAIKVRRAQLVAGQAASDQLPSLSVKGSSTASRLLDGGPTTRLSSVTAGVSWEVDLWGRLASQRQAADWEAQATEQDRQAAAMSLVGTVANLYWQVAYLNQRVAASEQSIDYARQTLKLVDAQYKVGAASGLEVAQATQALAAQEASHTQWLQQRVQARNALAVLFDGPPSVAMPESMRLPEGSLPEVQPDAPASLLARRPDLQASEMRLRKALAAVDATRSSFYPSLSLTGSVGGSSAALSNVLNDPVGRLGAGLVLPFVQWRDMQRSVDIS
ncbi:MAG: efflux transporter outer membrane subunit, partial [Aquabacterium sp.]|nr:efflux transporter outer membrane subunit [Aquabacterium sp.]